MSSELLVILLIQFVLITLASALMLPTTVLLVECVAALILPFRSRMSNVDWNQIEVAVLIPAHNEAAVIQLTLTNLIPQLKPCDRIVVIADNCEDETAVLARSRGAIAIERHDLEHQGKGYALDFGLRYLQNKPPEVVVMVDADCELSTGTLETLVTQTLMTGLPAQAAYLLEPPLQPSPKNLISAFAFKVKNLVRPLGLYRLGLPCLLTGTGMAFPWTVLQSIDLASGHIVEDMKLGIDLAIAGYPPQFCPDALVTSKLPQELSVAKGQRTRWEHGHLQVMKISIPQLLQSALGQWRPDLLPIALDLCVPPLALLVFLCLILTVLSLLAGWLINVWLPLILLSVAGLMIFTAIILVWVRFSRSELPLAQLLAVPLYVLWKIPLYLKFIIQPQSHWNRTDRDVSIVDK